MMKRILALMLATIVLCLSFNVCAISDDYARFIDKTGSLTDEEFTLVHLSLGILSEACNIDLAIVVSEYIEDGFTLDTDAIDWYNFLELDENGLLLYVAMEEQEWTFVENGSCKDVIDDATIEYLDNAFYSALDEEYIYIFLLEYLNCLYTAYGFEATSEGDDSTNSSTDTTPIDSATDIEIDRFMCTSDITAENGLPNDEQIVLLNTALNEISKKLNMDVAIMLIDSPSEGYSMDKEAYEWYELFDYADNGVMLLLSMSTQEWYIYTNGEKAQNVIDENAIELLANGNDVINGFVAYLEDSNFYEGYNAFISGVDYIATNYTGTATADGFEDYTFSRLPFVKTLTEDDGLPTSEQMNTLSAKLDSLSVKLNMDIAICIIETIDEGDSVEDIAIELYELLGYADNGVMLLMAMQSRDWYILNCGDEAIKFLNYDARELISKGGEMTINGESTHITGFLTYFAENNFYDGYLTFIDNVDKLFSYCRETGEPYKAPFSPTMPIIVSIIIGLIVALIITGIWKKPHKNVRFQSAAGNYVKHDTLSITESRDFFLYKTLTRRERPKNNSSSSSSSGRSYSGGGGKF